MENNYGGRSVLTEANDGIALATVSEDKDKPKKGGKKKEVTCFRCKKVGHYASECDEELPQKNNTGSNILITDESSNEEEEHDDGDDPDDDNEVHEQYKRTEDDEQDAEETSGVGDAESVGSTEDDAATETEEEEDVTGQLDDEDYEGVMFAQEEIMCNLQEKPGIPSSWILLDSQSTVDVFCNINMLTNVREAKRHLTLHCNAGTVQVTLVTCMDTALYGIILVESRTYCP